MPRGGARNRSGPAPDPRSRTSERRGYSLTALPSEGYELDPPKFPLPRTLRKVWQQQEGARFQVIDEGATELFRERELEVWAEAWNTPQACAWSMESWRWPIVAEFCRLKTVVETEPDANASLVAQMHRYRDQIGLTPAGLRDNGWAIAKDEVAAKRAEKDDEQQSEPTPAEGRVRRLR